MFNILVVDDDKNTRRLISDTLRDEGYKVFTAENGEDALTVLDHQHIDIAIVDVMMPKMDGLTFTKTLRDGGVNITLLMVTAKGEPEDVKHGFIVGIDDYMVKPVDFEEMMFRIKALLRRAKIVSERRLVIGGVTLDYDTFSVTRGSDRQILPKKEFLLLFKLLSYPDIIFTRYQLMDEIWGMDSESEEITVSVHVNKLRNRFKDYPEFDIETARGLGYKGVRKI